MAKHAFAVYIVSINRRYKTTDRQNLGNLNGFDFSHLLHGLLKDVESNHLKTEKTQRILIVSEVISAGRTISFKTRHGAYGVDGEIVNADTAEVTHNYGEDESPVSPTRNMLIIPKHGQYGLYLAERYGGGGAASMVRKTMVAALKKRFDDEFTLRVEGLQDLPSWQAFVERARMTDLEVNRYSLSSDSADESVVKTVGRIVTSFKPRRGVRFANAVKMRLVRREVMPDQLVGMDFGEDYEAVIGLDDDSQRRRLVLGRDEPPTLVYQVAEDEDERPTDDEIYSTMRSKLPEFGEVVTSKLENGWEAGTWSDDSKAVTMRANRDE